MLVSPDTTAHDTKVRRRGTAGRASFGGGRRARPRRAAERPRTGGSPPPRRGRRPAGPRSAQQTVGQAGARVQDGVTVPGPVEQAGPAQDAEVPADRSGARAEPEGEAGGAQRPAEHLRDPRTTG
ncbi:hypothetical protein GCM10010510_21380 [Streptomyces anandii JCM 4720]|nr:hypothetical protein GCM10010510_21380 [Streptomyces anandii JCM 4720]